MKVKKIHRTDMLIQKRGLNGALREYDLEKNNSRPTSGFDRSRHIRGQVGQSVIGRRPSGAHSPTLPTIQCRDVGQTGQGSSATNPRTRPGPANTQIGQTFYSDISSLYCT